MLFRLSRVHVAVPVAEESYYSRWILLEQITRVYLFLMHANSHGPLTYDL